MSTSNRASLSVLRSHRSVPEIYDDLREQIVSVVLAPGSSMSEARIAESYGVSRTPVREAFKRLAEDGFLEVIPQVGTYVARIDVQRVLDNHFVRETLECRIVDVAARRIEMPQRAALQRNLAQQTEATSASDPAAFFRADEAMHRLFAEIAGHASAWQVIHAAKGQLDRIRRLSLDDPKRSSKRMKEHRQIAACVIDRDSNGAVAAMRAHLASIFDSIGNIATDHAHYFVEGAPLSDLANRGADASSLAKRRA